ncbi:cytochrome P450 705A5-like [Corylus avellana]|uniref:cytochrome P450 705A5-like n=1 Tax=Corylus avellana TaxID=13451 RepID=UPI002869FB90|nr:cytochrome P450 705A5-like [Corylus avellana]
MLSNKVERSRAVRREEMERLLRRVLGSAETKEGVVDVGAELMRYTNNVTCRMVMSSRCSEEEGEAERVIELVKESFELAAKMCFGDVLGPLKKLGFWVYGKQAMDMTRRFDELLEKVLKEHEERGKKGGWGEREDKDLMDMLLEVCQDEQAEVKITRTHIKAFFTDLFIAGTGTSAEAMQWAIAELINHPCVFQKVRQEIESVVGKARLIEESDIPNLPYLQAVVKETLRLYPPAPVTTRECRQSCKINGFDIPEKTAVAINLYAIMRDQDSWDDPNKFIPERFLVSFKEQSEVISGQKFNFVPFGAGRRGCPGTTLAFSLMNTAVASLVQCFDWEVDGDGGKVDIQSGPGMSLRMVHPLTARPVVHFTPFTAST